MPQVSVVIPAFNAAEHIGKAIESVLAQSFEDFEVVVIDDRSSDRTPEVVSRYARRDSRIRFFTNEANLGIAGNRNKGLALAVGKYIAWQDADDISLPARLEHQVRYLEANPDVGIVGGYIEIFRAGKSLGVRKYPADDGSLRRCIFRYSPVAQPAAMIPRAVFGKVGLYDPRYSTAEDIDMTFRIGEQFMLGNLQEIVLRYRESTTSSTFTGLRGMELNTLAIRRRYARSPRYRFSPLDALYNAMQLGSVWLIPPRMKIRLFNFWRNTDA